MIVIGCEAGFAMGCK